MITERFWALIEAAWATASPAANAERRALATRTPSPEPFEDEVEIPHVEDALDSVIAQLTASCVDLSDAELTDLDRVLERALYDIDRGDIHEFTDGSDDGFLYARGFIVALGRDYYEAVLADPAMAVEDAECEEMCYLFAHLYSERHGNFPDTGSGISRESGSNEAGWPDPD